jgi:hypothetical protein
VAELKDASKYIVAQLLHQPGPPHRRLAKTVMPVLPQSQLRASAPKNLVVGGRGQGTEERVLRGRGDPRSRAENGEEHVRIVLHRVLVWALDAGLHSTHRHRLCLRHCHPRDGERLERAGPILVKRRWARSAGLTSLCGFARMDGGVVIGQAIKPGEIMSKKCPDDTSRMEILRFADGNMPALLPDPI